MNYKLIKSILEPLSGDYTSDCYDRLDEAIQAKNAEEIAELCNKMLNDEESSINRFWDTTNAVICVRGLCGSVSEPPVKETWDAVERLVKPIYNDYTLDFFDRLDEAIQARNPKRVLQLCDEVLNADIESAENLQQDRGHLERFPELTEAVTYVQDLCRSISEWQGKETTETTEKAETEVVETTEKAETEAARTAETPGTISTMTSRSEMVNAEIQKLQTLTDFQLAQTICRYFEENQTLPGEKALKDMAKDLTAELGGEATTQLIGQVRDDLIEQFASLCVKEVKLTKAIANDQACKLHMTPVSSASPGVNVEKNTWQLPVRINEQGYAITMDEDAVSIGMLPDGFRKNHGTVSGMEASLLMTDYSSGKFKNLSWTLMVDLGQTLMDQVQANKAMEDDFAAAVAGISDIGGPTR